MDEFDLFKLKPMRHRDRVYQLRIDLEASEPKIWRRIEVTGETTLKKLHRIIQRAFGWTESHLHQFLIDDVTYTDPTFEMDEMGDEVENQARMKLRLLGLRAGDRFNYTYDFGDNWEHIILVEAVNERDAALKYPRCTGGERAGPPDDCGGVWGYAEMLKTLKGKKSAARTELLGWLPDGFDPEHFSLEELNRYIGK